MSGKADEVGRFAAVSLANSNFLCSRIAYKLDLKGPVFAVQTACSTSLTAIDLACRGILTGQCNMALAGGISVKGLREARGYLFKEGMIRSPDGHCRAFDAKAKGTAGGEGAGVVVLKLLEEALADRDTIHAIIKGSASNNDGSRKVGYTAPSVEGQAEVIRAAHLAAEIDPESISYIETHGTGTPLGDPVEIEALKQGFGTNKKGFCLIGSVKTNVGHLDTAAGVAGFIKTVLALEHHLIPPSLHFETPNPKIDFENSPFHVNTTLKEWKRGDYPRRAGVSAFGIGGTNVHVILEEWPVNKGALFEKTAPLTQIGRAHV
jgi:acyl transferase domain-containing protein